MSVSWAWVRGASHISQSFPPEAQDLIGDVLSPRERARTVGTAPARNPRSEYLGLTVFPQSVRRLQETEMWAELCPSAKGAIFLYNEFQESST